MDQYNITSLYTLKKISEFEKIKISLEFEYDILVKYYIVADNELILQKDLSVLSKGCNITTLHNLTILSPSSLAEFKNTGTITDLFSDSCTINSSEESVEIVDPFEGLE